MAVKSFGPPLSLFEIAQEFGFNRGTSISLGSYRINQTVSGLVNLPLDENVPQPGNQIGIGSFYSKKLNVVVDETPGVGTTFTRVSAKNDYDANNNKVKVIGGFRSRPSSPAGIKVWIHTNGSIGSDVAASSASRNYCSLLTGTWDASTDLIVDIGPSGNVMGAGGKGGKGGDQKNNPNPGNNGSNGVYGTSALGVTVTNNTVIRNRGTIIAGGGGGGGGGSAWGQHKAGNKYRDGGAAGSGGGGGQGYPAGSGGAAGLGNAGSNGGNGTATNGGAGGKSGWQSDYQAVGVGGAGGGGSSNGQGGAGDIREDNGPQAQTANGGNGSLGKGGDGSDGAGAGSNSSSSGTGGVGGPSGHAIIVSGASNQVTITGAATGDIVYETAPE